RKLLPRANHVAGEVRLAEVGGPAHGPPGFRGELTGQLLLELDPALGPVEDRAELLVPHDLLQLLNLGLEPGLTVLLPVEPRVLEARPENGFVAAPDRFGSLAPAVPDRDKMGEELPGLALEREGPLMGPHRREDGRGGNPEAALLEMTQVT